MKELGLYSLAIAIFTIVGKLVFKIQNDMLLFLVITGFFCILTFIFFFVIDKEKEEKLELTNEMKKEKNKFLISEGILFAVIMANNLISNTTLVIFALACLQVGLIVWTTTLIKSSKETVWITNGKMAWLYFCVLPAIYVNQFIIWTINDISRSPLFHR